jgi:hypothetical protein
MRLSFVFHLPSAINDCTLIDTDVISEARKEKKANAGVRQFFADADRARARNRSIRRSLRSAAPARLPNPSPRCA